MAESVFRKISANRSKIVYKLFDNITILKLLYNIKDDIPLDDMELPKDPFEEIYKKKVFPRTNIDGITDKEDCYIMLDFPYIKPNEAANNEYADAMMTFTIMCHKNVVSTFDGDRIDLISAEIFDLFYGSREFGFRISTPIIRSEFHKDYYIVRMIFELTDFV